MTKRANAPGTVIMLIKITKTTIPATASGYLDAVAFGEYGPETESKLQESQWSDQAINREKALR
jgi:hypothetical protein